MIMQYGIVDSYRAQLHVACRLEIPSLLLLGMMTRRGLPNCRTQKTYLNMQPWRTTFGMLFALIRFSDQPPFFRFGKILYISDEFENVHVEWFEHSTKTAVEQLGHPQELFLTNICSTVEFDLIVQKVSVQFVDPSKEMPVIGPYNFFYKSTSSATFENLTDILPAGSFMIALMVHSQKYRKNDFSTERSNTQTTTVLCA
jgi:hypothetical protein